MKTLETSRWGRLATWLGNVTAVDMDRITSVAWLSGFYVSSENKEWSNVTVFNRSLCSWVWISGWFPVEAKSLFYNGRFFWRKVYVDGKLRGLFWSYRWAGRNPNAKEYIQLGIGTKLNGRFGLLLRIQSDAAGAAGVTGPNVGQAIGFEFGTK